MNMLIHKWRLSIWKMRLTDYIGLLLHITQLPPLLWICDTKKNQAIQQILHEKRFILSFICIVCVLRASTARNSFLFALNLWAHSMLLILHKQISFVINSVVTWHLCHSIFNVFFLDEWNMKHNEYAVRCIYYAYEYWMHYRKNTDSSSSFFIVFTLFCP